MRLVLWSLRHRKWRHGLNIVTMAITVSVVMIFVSVMAELVGFVRTSADREMSRILVSPKMMGSGALPMTLGATLEELDGAQVVQRYMGFGGRHPSGATYVVVGEEESGIELNTDFFPVEPEVIEAWKNERPRGAIVTEETAEDLGLRVGQSAEVPTPFGPLQIEVVGISTGGRVANRIAIHFDYAQEHLGNPGMCLYRVFTNPDDLEPVALKIVENTRNSPTPVQAVSDAHFLASLAREAATVPAVLGFLGIFLVFTTALTLANNSAISIRERRVEIATLRVLGFHRGRVLRSLLGETALVGVAGGLVAVAITMWLFRGGVQLAPGDSLFLQAVEITPTAIAGGLMTSVLVPLAGALFPALAALRMPLNDALRDSA